MGFWKNVKKTLTTISFKGRASRKEIIDFFLFNLLFGVISGLFFGFPLVRALVTISTAPSIKVGMDKLSSTFLIYMFIVGIILTILYIWLSIASITLNVRRFHDLGLSGWVYFAFIVVTAIITIAPEQYQTACTILSYALGFGLFIYLASVKGSVNANKFGEPVVPPDNIEKQ